MNWLVEPLGYAFMVRALLAVVMVGTVSALVGTFVVLRGMAFFGDALAHTILPGLAVGYLVNGRDREGLFWWALVTAIGAALGIGAISRSSKVRDDTAIGVVFAGMFALGIALISMVRSFSVDLTHFLFGDILGVSNGDLWRIAIFGGLAGVVILAFLKEFTVLAFDPVLAATLRLPTRLLESLLLVLIAVTIVVSLQAVGVALMVALLVTPAATAYLLTRRLGHLMLLAVALSVISGVVGLYMSYYLAVASGAAIVLVSTIFFGLAWVWSSFAAGQGKPAKT